MSRDNHDDSLYSDRSAGGRPPAGQRDAIRLQQDRVDGGELWDEDRAVTPDRASLTLRLPKQWARMQDGDLTETGVTITVYADRIEVVPRVE
jgi:hypothetical protein